MLSLNNYTTVHKPGIRYNYRTTNQPLNQENQVNVIIKSSIFDFFGPFFHFLSCHKNSGDLFLHLLHVMVKYNPYMVQMCYIFISVYFRYDKIKNMLKSLTVLQQKMNTENLYNICKIK